MADDEGSNGNEKKNQPSIPANYVSIVQLRERRIKEQEMKEKEKEERELKQRQQLQKEEERERLQRKQMQKQKQKQKQKPRREKTIQTWKVKEKVSNPSDRSNRRENSGGDGVEKEKKPAAGGSEKKSDVFVAVVAENSKEEVGRKKSSNQRGKGRKKSDMVGGESHAPPVKSREEEDALAALEEKEMEIERKSEVFRTNEGGRRGDSRYYSNSKPNPRFNGGYRSRGESNAVMVWVKKGEVDSMSSSRESETVRLSGVGNGEERVS